jgi:hypothetical protein
MMTRHAGVLLVATLLSAGQALSEVPLPAVPSEIATGSTPGWQPSDDDKNAALKLVTRYLESLDQGRYEQAYALQSEGFRGVIALQRFSEDSRRFASEAGALKQRSILKQVWAKDPPNESRSGYYATIIVASAYVNIDLNCHTVALYETPDGGGLQLRSVQMRYRMNEPGRAAPPATSDREADWAKQARRCLN